MKKGYISPTASLLVSLSLALGILVGDVGGNRFLTTAHAQEGGNCTSEDDATILSDLITVEDGRILNGMTVHNVNVNGIIVEQAIIVGSVQLINTTVEGSNVIQASGVLIGSGGPCTNGVLIGSGGSTNGVLIGSGGSTTNGVLIGSGTPVVSGVTGEATGTAVGGSLTGDNIVVTDGVITGQNLLLSGATINQGSISGTITSVTITPTN